MAESGDQEKTEEATPKKREEARKEGQVARSADLTTALTLCGALLSLTAGAPVFVISAKGMFKQILRENGLHTFDTQELIRTLASTMGPMIKAGLFLVVPIMGVGVLANIVQVGWQMTPDAMTPKYNRVDPIQGFSRIFSWGSVGTFTTGVLKLGTLGGLAYFFISAQFKTFPQFPQLKLDEIFSFGGGLITTLGWRIAGCMVLIGLADFIFQRWRQERDLRMSKQEIKDEQKQQDGDPQLKQRIKQIQRQNSMHRMMEDVPKATVVITNPTHFAVALQYEPGMGAPRVIAKGQNLVALRIKKRARDLGIHIEEDPPLARGLFATTQIGQDIPPEFYRAIALVLAVIMKNKQPVVVPAQTQPTLAGGSTR